MALCLRANALTLNVSPGGSDAGQGTPSRPFATIERARDEIRRLKAAGGLPQGGISVQIAAGRYCLDHSLVFSSQDSGTAESPIEYSGFPSRQAELLGGVVIKRTDFSEVTDPDILARIDPMARGHVVTLSLKALGIRHGGPFPVMFSDSGGIFELFWNGRRLPLSRWPNQGWATLKRAVVNGDSKTPGVFEYRDDRPSRWLHNPEVWLKGQWRVPWEDPAIRVARIDPTSHTITFAAGLSNGIGNKYTRPAGNGKEPWCAINLIEEIDSPGEWAVDFAHQRLYLWPPDGNGELMISQLSTPVIEVDGASHLQFSGLTVEASLGDGIVVTGAQSVTIAGCTLRNLARRGIVLNARSSTVQSCDISEVGEGCIYVSGGDKRTLTPSGNAIVNNHLHHYAVLKAMYSPAIDVGFGGMPNGGGFTDAVGIRVANNLIHDAPRDAVLVSGEDNVFEYNEIFNCGFGSGDVGAFYSWLDWTIRGVVIRYNYVHDTVGGVNPDDGASGNHVYGNVFVGPRTGIWIASGPDHTVENNIFVKDEGPVFGMDDRGVARGYATNARLHQTVMAVHPDQAPWVTRFPEMATLLGSHPELPLRTRFERNLIVMKTGEPFVLKMSRPRQLDPTLFTAADNLVTATDPGFVDAAHGNYALRQDSVAFSKIPGFKPIPWDKIGLQRDPYRLTLPSAEEVGRPSQPSDSKDLNFGT